MADITITNCGSIFLFLPETAQATEWIQSNVGESTMFGAALAVEHRYAQDLAAAMVADGLEVE